MIRPLVLSYSMLSSLSVSKQSPMHIRSHCRWNAFAAAPLSCTPVDVALRLLPEYWLRADDAVAAGFILVQEVTESAHAHSYYSNKEAQKAS